MISQLHNKIEATQNQLLSMTSPQTTTVTVVSTYDWHFPVPMCLVPKSVTPLSPHLKIHKYSPVDPMAIPIVDVNQLGLRTPDHLQMQAFYAWVFCLTFAVHLCQDSFCTHFLHFSTQFAFCSLFPGVFWEHLSVSIPLLHFQAKGSSNDSLRFLPALYPTPKLFYPLCTFCHFLKKQHEFSNDVRLLSILDHCKKKKEEEMTPGWPALSCHQVQGTISSLHTQ